MLKWYEYKVYFSQCDVFDIIFVIRISLYARLIVEKINVSGIFKTR